MEGEFASERQDHAMRASIKAIEDRDNQKPLQGPFKGSVVYYDKFTEEVAA